jgi:hypothetical protein
MDIAAADVRAGRLNPDAQSLIALIQINNWIADLFRLVITDM